MNPVIRFVIVIVVLLAAAVLCAATVWASIEVDRDKRRRRAVDEAVDGAVEQFEREKNV